MKTKIYVLCEPRKGEIRYVGKTIGKLTRRLSSHLSEARSGVKNHRCNWIRSLLKRGVLPTIQMVGEVEGDGNQEEIAWIVYGQIAGWKLVNETDGGDGGHRSAETRKKMSMAQTGNQNRKIV